MDRRYQQPRDPKDFEKRADSDSGSVEKLFKKMRIQDRSEILDKIHNMRINNFDKKAEADVAKPHLPQLSNVEKEKIVEQYFAAKKQLNTAAQNHSGKHLADRLSSAGMSSEIIGSPKH